MSGSLLNAHLSIQGLLCSTKVVGGCAKMARELKWNSQILPPTCRSLIKAPVLFSLAICLLHVSMIVELCVICCDSFIILESTDVALLYLQIQQRPNSFSVALDERMRRSSKGIMTSLTFLKDISEK